MFNIKNIKIFDQPFKMFIIDDFINEKIFIKLREKIIIRVVKFLEKKTDVGFRHELVERYDNSKKKGEIIVSGGGGHSGKHNSIENMYDLFKDVDSTFKEFFSQFTQKRINKKFYRLLVPFSFQNFISFRPLKIHEENSDLSI